MRLLILSLLFMPFSLFAQPGSTQPVKTSKGKLKAETRFLKVLNDIASRYMIDGDMVGGRSAAGYMITLDSSFAIDQNGVLTATWRFKNDTSYYTLHVEFPVGSIEEVYYDFNMGFSMHEGGKEYISKLNSKEIGETSDASIIKVATPGDGKHGPPLHEKLKAALVDVKRYYLKDTL